MASSVSFGVLFKIQQSEEGCFVRRNGLIVFAEASDVS